MWLATIVFILAIVSFAIALKQEAENKKVLRHTIRVNLGILRSELKDLTSLTVTDEIANDFPKAQIFLRMSAFMADQAEKGMDKASERSLGEKLSIVFIAMDFSLQARHLLKAVQPYEPLE